MPIRARLFCVYGRIVETLIGYTASYAGRKLAEAVTPLIELAAIARRLKETEEARSLLEKPPEG